MLNWQDNTLSKSLSEPKSELRLCNNRNSLFEFIQDFVLVYCLSPLKHQQLKVFGVWGLFSKSPHEYRLKCYYIKAPANNIGLILPRFPKRC